MDLTCSAQLPHIPALATSLPLLFTSCSPSTCRLITVCYLHDQYQYSSLCIESAHNKASYFRFEVAEQGVHYVSVIQKCKRMFQAHQNYEYSLVRMMLCKKTPGGFKYYGATMKREREVFIGENLTPGTYFLYVKTQWDRFKLNDFVLSCYAPRRVGLQRVQKAQAEGLLEAGLKSYASASGKLTPYASINLPYAQRGLEVDLKKGFGYLYLTNQGERTLCTRFNFLKLEGLTLRKPYALNGQQIELYVPPQTEVILIFKVSELGYQIQHQEQF